VSFEITKAGVAVRQSGFAEETGAIDVSGGRPVSSLQDIAYALWRMELAPTCTFKQPKEQLRLDRGPLRRGTA
jgi:hypothetical protein